MKKFLIIACALWLSACHSIKAIERPELEASEWQATLEEANNRQEIDWWKAFTSLELNRLIEQAFEQSPDLRIASERVWQAELQMRNAGVDLLPSLGANASVGGGKSRASGSSWTNNESSRVSVGINYEIDLWGRIAAGKASAAANYEAQQFDYEATRLSLITSIAKSWFQWLSTKQRLATALNNIEVAEKVYQFVGSRYNNGAATATELANQKSSVLSQQAALYPLQLEERKLRAGLATLVGQEPFSLVLREESLLDMHLPNVDVYVPSELLSRRPDLAATEARLQAADANVKVARANLFPSLQLSLSAGRSSTEAFSLSGGTDSLAATASLAQVIFQGGRLRNQVKITESQRIALLEEYRKAIYQSLEEVENALHSVHITELQEQQQREIVSHAENALRLIDVGYMQGSDDLRALLEAQRDVFQKQDQLVQIRQTRFSAMLDLYKALGGSWKQQ